jgi:hypothetical protein
MASLRKRGRSFGGVLHCRKAQRLRQLSQPWWKHFGAYLIYDLSLDDQGGVDIVMTLTAPACPVAGTLPGEVAESVAAVNGTGEVAVTITWDPPWTPENMSEVARVALDMF